MINTFISESVPLGTEQSRTNQFSLSSPMASDAAFMEYVLDQISGAGEVNAKKMFGEYGLYCDGVFFGMVCDNKLFIKPTNAGKSFMGAITEGIPYPGAKPSLLIEEKLEDRDWLAQLIQITITELPPPKKKKPMKKWAI